MIRPVGRPSLSDGETAPLTIRLPADLRERATADAERRDESLSEWVREAMERKLKKAPPKRGRCVEL